jgi:hypothetical protein
MSPLIRWWLHGQWAREAQADAVDRVQAVAAMLATATALLLLLKP